MVNLKLQVLGGNPKLKKKALAKITQIEEKNFVWHLASKNSEWSTSRMASSKWKLDI